MKYRLIRTTPEGQEKEQGTAKSIRMARVLAAHVLHDNGVASKADAQVFSARMETVPLGETVSHESGYKFRIEEVKEHG